MLIRYDKDHANVDLRGSYAEVPDGQAPAGTHVVDAKKLEAMRVFARYHDSGVIVAFDPEEDPDEYAEFLKGDPSEYDILDPIAEDEANRRAGLEKQIEDMQAALKDLK